MPSARTLRLVTLVRINVSEESSASIIRVAIIGEIGTKLAVTSNRFLKEPQDVTSLKTPFFLIFFTVTAVETYILTE
jgi:hypothetical protein